MRRVLALALLSVLFPAPIALADGVADLVRSELAARLDAAADWDVRVSGPAPDVVRIDVFWHDAAAERFVADARRRDGRAVRISGRFTGMTTVPVTTRTIMPGERIVSSDVAMTRLPVRRVSDRAVRAPEAVIGREATRMLPSGRAIREDATRIPVLIARGARVEIRFAGPKLAVAAPAKALSDASVGEALRVVNLVSNRTLRVRAVAEGLVEVIQ